MKSKEAFKILLLTLVSFATYYILFLNFQIIKSALDKITHQGLTSYILTYFIIGIPIFIGTYLINKEANIFKSLGLSKNMWTGIWVAVLFTLPMFAGGCLFFKFNKQIEIESLIGGTIVAGFMEELYFRGFLFGAIFQKTTLGFIPSIFFGAIIFASGHLYQSQELGELFGIFMITFFGAFFFAWLFVEWNFNLWVPIFTHTLMNLSWNLFLIDNSALGDMKANIFRGLTIFIAIFFTVKYKKKRTQKLTINKKTLLMKK